MIALAALTDQDRALSTVSLFAAILGLGIAIQWIASRLQVPALILLLGCGLLLGPGLGVLNPDELFGDLLQPMISLAVALVLFEGGLTLRFEEARRAGPVLWRLIATGLIVGFAGVTLLGYFVAGLSLPTAAVLGAILVVTGPTVILPMLRQAKIAMRPATLLKWEGIVNDPLGALLAVVVFQIAIVDTSHDGALASLIFELSIRALGAAALGGAAGVLLGRALRADLLAETLKSPVMLAAVVVVYAIAEHIGEENGLLAVTVFGIVLANVNDASIAEIQHFKEQISVLLVALVIVLIRPLVVAIATWRSGLPLAERVLVGWIGPRGVVAAAVAGAFATRLAQAGHADARLLVPIVFGVILATVLLQGLTIQYLAGRLGLGGRAGTGIVIVGASNWALALAQALTKAGAFVVLTDTRYHHVSRARRRGFTSFYGDVLSWEAHYELPLERISWVFAATDDDAYNALVCMEFARELGRSSVLQLTPEPGAGGKEGEHRTVGRTPWGDRGSYRALASGYWVREQFKVTKLTPEFPLERLWERHPDALLLFQVTDGGRIAPIDSGNPPGLGVQIVFLEESARPAIAESA